jgi:hypothetical protein
MRNRPLKETLEHLHRELSSAESVDPESLALLRTLTDDIDRFLEKRGTAGSKDAAAESAPDTSGLRGLLLKFEAEHPEFSVAVGRVADALAAVGI